MEEEQKLSRLIRGDEFEEAALLAFRLNKLRDFYHVLHKMMQVNKTQRANEDQVDSVLASIKQFETIKKADFSVSTLTESKTSDQ